MKTLARIFIIVAVMALVMGVTYAAVSASGSSGLPGAEPRFEEGGRPPFREGRFEGERPEGFEGGGWMFGLIKNVGVITVLVTLIVLPKNVRRKRKRAAVAG
ncbi:MAG: hypothetical protein ACOYYF_03800 [Chloroflexota bacterium]|nr:hypothetical protein [Chloroflexota bacterium]MBI5703800.1 hypothetical protein [Chloroflexota bacterium]